VPSESVNRKRIDIAIVKRKRTDKKTSKDLQNTSQKTKDRKMLSPLKPRMNSDTQEG